MTKELLQQALDALTRLSFLGNGDFPGNSEGNRIAQKAVADIKQALSQQERSYPVAEYEDGQWWVKELESLFVAPIGSGVTADQKRAANIALNFMRTVWVQQEQPASVDAYTGAREDAAIWKKRALEAEELNRKFIAELNGPTYLGEPAQQEPVAQQFQDADGKWHDFMDEAHRANTIRSGNWPIRSLYAAPPTQPAQDLYPLPDSLYPGSKDWMAGSYKERVEWLHGMYESAKQEIARLEAQQAQEPVMYQYRWLNPGDNPDQPESELEWKLVEVRNVYTDTIANRIDELRGYRFSGKPVYEVRPLYAAPPTQPALSDEQIAEIAKPFISSMGDHWCHEDGIRDNGAIEEFARAVIEAHCRGGAK